MYPHYLVHMTLNRNAGVVTIYAEAVIKFELPITQDFLIMFSLKIYSNLPESRKTLSNAGMKYFFSFIELLGVHAD